MKSPLLAATCFGLAACSTTGAPPAQGLAPTSSKSSQASLAQTAASAEPNLVAQAGANTAQGANAKLDQGADQTAAAAEATEEGQRSLAYEVERNGAKKKRLKGKAGADTEAAAEPGAEATQLAAAAPQGADAAVADPIMAAAYGDANGSKASRALPAPARPGDQSGLPGVAPKPAQRPVQVASLDPTAGLDDTRFGVSESAPAIEVEETKTDPNSGVSHSKLPPKGRLGPSSVAAGSAELDQLIAQYASYYDVPEKLVRRVVKRESTFNPRARNGIYMGLMQISPATARGMGFRGSPSALLDAETNLKYAVRYLRGAYVVARGNHDKADRLYQTGYYYHAKRMGLLDETGVGKDRKRRSRRG